MRQQNSGLKPMIKSSRHAEHFQREPRAVKSGKMRYAEWAYEGKAKGLKPSSSCRELHPLSRKRAVVAVRKEWAFLPIWVVPQEFNALVPVFRGQGLFC